MEIQGQIVAVDDKTTSKGVVYEIRFSDGNTYSTWKAALGAAAKGAVNTPVAADVSVKPNGQYTNYYWNGFKPVVGGAGTSTPTVLHTPIPVAPAPQNGGMSPEREQKIVRQSSLSTAFNFVGQLYQGAGPDAHDEAVALARKLAKGLYESVFHHEQKPATPQQVAEQVPGVQVGVETPPAPKQDDLPW